MYAPIQAMPNTSRIWIYQSNRELKEGDEQFIIETLKDFCSRWAAHGNDLQTSFDIAHHRFIIFAVNEQAGSPSGCSIDSSTHIIKKIEQGLNVDFFNRSEIAFLEDGLVQIYSLTNLKKLFEARTLNENSVALNTLVATLGEWRNQSTMKVKDGWLKRYIPKVQVA